MSLIDYLIIIIILFSTLISFTRGFIRESLSIVTCYCAILFSVIFYSSITKYITFFENLLIKNIIAILIIIIAVMITGKILNNIVIFFTKKIGLSNIDNILGICFGLFKGVLIVLLLLFFFKIFPLNVQKTIRENSKFIQYFDLINILFFNI
ncbi:CvpA family protein [Candidatus Providencia siddallii]|uniref:Colicin V production protein n=1 Tax=Candidatus Providencia siddallii TaxID=1715285 RepID=A0ABM9NNN7_9GAMM